MRRMASSSSRSGSSHWNNTSARSRGGTDTSGGSLVSSRASVAESTWSLNSTAKPVSSTESESGFMDAPPKDLWFKTLNPYAPVTVVMVHLLFSCHLEWAHVWPKLTEYHLLIPDLPHHSRSRHIKPFSFSLAVDLIADMIRKHAQGGRAHIVGISTGGYIGQELVRRYPDLVLGLFASGCSPVRETWVNQRPKLLQYGLLAMLHSPNSFFLKITGWSPEFSNTALLKEVKKNTTSRVVENGLRDTSAFQQEAVLEIATKGIRIALIVGGKQDDYDSAREAAEAFSGCTNFGPGLESRGFIVRDAIHAWNLQQPDLFARGIQAWIEGWPMPPEYVPLS